MSYFALFIINCHGLFAVIVLIIAAFVITVLLIGSLQQNSLSGCSQIKYMFTVRKFSTIPCVVLVFYYFIDVVSSGVLFCPLHLFFVSFLLLVSTVDVV